MHALPPPRVRVLPFGQEPDEAEDDSVGADAAAMESLFNPPPLAHLPPVRSVWPPPSHPRPRGGLASAMGSLFSSGGDLVVAPLPPHLSEPGTHLSKQAEAVEYAGLLTSAAAAPPGSVERAAIVFAFALSWHGNSARRTDKPPNPGPGETLDVVCDGGRVRGVWEATYLSLAARRYECAWHVRGPGWTLDGCDAPRARVAGASLEIDTRLRARVTFDGDGESFRVTRAAARLHVAARAPYFTLLGPTLAASDAPGGCAVVATSYGQPSLLGGGGGGARNAVDAPVTAAEGGGGLPGSPRVVGDPITGLDLVWGDGRRPPARLWTRAPLPPGARGGATAFVAGLCHYVPSLHASIPPTDSRRRADVAAIAAGDWGAAAAAMSAAWSAHVATVKAWDAGTAPRPPPRWFVEVKGKAGGEGPWLAWEWGGEDYWGARDAGAREE